MLKFDSFLDILKEDLADTAKTFGSNYVNDFLKDGTVFVNNMRENLERRSKLLVSGELTKEDFKWLLESDKDLLKMEAIKQRGLAEVQLKKIQDAIIGTVFGAVTKSLKL